MELTNPPDKPATALTHGLTVLRLTGDLVVKDCLAVRSAAARRPSDVGWEDMILDRSETFDLKVLPTLPHLCSLILLHITIWPQMCYCSVTLPYPVCNGSAFPVSLSLQLPPTHPLSS